MYIFSSLFTQITSSSMLTAELCYSFTSPSLLCLDRFFRFSYYIIKIQSWETVMVFRDHVHSHRLAALRLRYRKKNFLKYMASDKPQTKRKKLEIRTMQHNTRKTSGNALKSFLYFVTIYLNITSSATLIISR